MLMVAAWLFVLAGLPFPGTTAIDNSDSSSGSRFNRRSRTDDTYSNADAGTGSTSGRSVFGSRSSNSSNRNTNNKDNTPESRAKTRERASNQPGAKGSTAAPKKGEKTVKGKEAPAKKAASGGQSGSATTVEFKMHPSPNANILCVETTDLASTMHTVAQVGQSLVTRVVFRNGQQTRFDTIEFALSYDPKVLELEGIDDQSISSSLAEPATARVDASRGVLTYRAHFAQPRKDDFLVICKLQWKARTPSEHTSIEFLNTPNFPSRVLSGDKNLLYPPAGSEDEQAIVGEPSPRQGLLGADVAVAPTADQLAEMKDDETPLTGVALARQIADGTVDGGITLTIQPRRRSVHVGEELLVDVRYDNPNRVEIDSVKVTLNFDPTVLEVVDDDEDGWITKGINVFDGDYHEQLPFDYHIRNVAYNSLGRIIYQMGFAARTRIPSGGILFTAKFRALAPSDATRIRFEFDDSQKNPPTSISFLGFNLIGSPLDRTSALKDATVTIEP
jgi:hypothetical protein